jgi:hypothetical protein
MKKWLVSIPLSADATYQIDAETKEEAIEKAYEKGVPTLCYQCADEVEIGDFAFDGDAVTEEIKS